jgi:peptide chain release factor 2
VVFCQNDRSQHRNRAQAWDMLRAKLFERELKKREERPPPSRPPRPTSAGATRSALTLLQPYQMVKDLRTGVQTSNTGGVLDGDLDQFHGRRLAQKAFGTAPANVEDVE